MTLDELRAKLMEDAGETIDKLLAEHKERAVMTEIEDGALAAGRSFMQSVTKRLVESCCEAQEQSPLCQVCGQELHSKGEKERWLTTRSGDIKIRRVYYYCENCRLGVFPLDEQLGLGEGSYSPALSQQVAWLAGLLSYAKVVETFVRIGGHYLSKTTVWTETQRQGEYLVTNLQQQQAQQAKQRVEESKVGSIPDVVTLPDMDGTTHAPVDIEAAINTAYASLLGDVEHFKSAVWALAAEKGAPQVEDSMPPADSAEWIWNLADDLFPILSSVLSTAPGESKR